MFIMRVGLSLLLVLIVIAMTSLNGKFICAYDAVGSNFLFAYITARGCFVGSCADIGGSMSVQKDIGDSICCIPTSIVLVVEVMCIFVSLGHSGRCAFLVGFCGHCIAIL